MIQYLENKCIFTNKYFKTADGLKINVCANNNAYWYLINDNTDNVIITTTENTDTFANLNSCIEKAKQIYENLTEVSDKEMLLEYMKTTQEPDNRRNRMGCSESWYDAFYAIKQTFEICQIESMTDVEINNLLALAANIQTSLY